MKQFKLSLMVLKLGGELLNVKLLLVIKIDYPKVQSPDILVAMSHEALLKYIVDLKDNGFFNC